MLKQNSNLIWGLAVVAMVVCGWLAFGMLAWDGPTDAEVRAAFLAEHPAAEVEAVYDHEDGPNRIQYQIVYQDGGSPLREAIWMFQRSEADHSRWDRVLPVGD